METYSFLFVPRNEPKTGYTEVHLYERASRAIRSSIVPQERAPSVQYPRYPLRAKIGYCDRDQL